MEFLSKENIQELSKEELILLVTRLQSDVFTAQQKEITLKNNIKKSLKLELEDFNCLENEELKMDIVAAYQTTLKNTFRKLKRNGIDIDIK